MELGVARRMFAALPVASVGTLNRDGSPHVVPLWFVWPDDAVYLSTRRPSRTWRNAGRDPRVSISIDVGRVWTELAGVSIAGRAEPIPAEHPGMRRPISAWHDKYRSLLAGGAFGRFAEEVPSLAFLRVVPDVIRAWDHARQ
jgi:nitroimidazol reductase NimA-like FMN-containing flavoprotein (pyridoxamine 5'-phosphate oxidase superfamily)